MGDGRVDKRIWLLKFREHQFEAFTFCCNFVTSVTSRDTLPTPQTENIHRIVLPFKDQRSADIVKKHLSELSNKIDHILQPVFSSRKLGDDLKVQEPKPPLINQQCVVYHFVCDLCDADYVGYTSRQLHQRID